MRPIACLDQVLNHAQVMIPLAILSYTSRQR
jgi:hypothetical protein